MRRVADNLEMANIVLRVSAALSGVQGEQQALFPDSNMAT